MNPPDAVAQLRRDLAAVAVPADAAPMAAYMKHRFVFLGVKTPARRTSIIRTHPESMTLTPLQVMSAAGLLEFDRVNSCLRATRRSVTRPLTHRQE